MSVTIPMKWWHDDAKSNIDGFLGEGTYNEHGHFDANNQARIASLWTVRDTTAIFNKLDKEYHAAMDKYTMGTGGGPGADENYIAWQQRDEFHVVQYTYQPSNIYLTIVHTWDEQFGFPFVSVKVPLPLDCAIDAGIDFGGFQDHSTNGGDDVLSIGYEELIAPMIKAIQELKAIVEELKSTR